MKKHYYKNYMLKFIKLNNKIYNTDPAMGHPLPSAMSSFF